MTPAALARPVAAKRAAPDRAAMLAAFPPRPAAGSWPATRGSRDEVLQRLLGGQIPPAGPPWNPQQRSLARVLDWLGEQPGDTWQARWLASGAEGTGNTAWRELAREDGAAALPRSDSLRLGRGLLPLIGGDVIRPSLGWLITPGSLKSLPAAMAAHRDPAGMAELAELWAVDPANPTTKGTALRRIATVMAAKGGGVAEVTVGDCLELIDLLAASGKDASPYFYQLLHTLGVFPSTAPRSVRAFATAGQSSVEQLVDRYDLACRPVRDLLVAYLRERQPVLDHVSLRQVSFALVKMFWKDLEVHHPGIDSLHLPPHVAAAWKQRIAVKTTTATEPAGGRIEVRQARADSGVNYLTTVRAFYLDIAQWAMEDPPRWGPWAAPCPIRGTELSRRKDANRRKARMDQRTRERLPALPALIAAADRQRSAAAQALQAARDTPPGGLFDAGGLTLRRAVLKAPEAARTWAEDPQTGKRRDLTMQEHRAFWGWAAVEVLRHTGVRVEELIELSHHSLVQYRLPTTGELVPLLQIAPSKSDAERMLVVDPELADVLATIICRVRGTDQALPLVGAYDIHERVWNPPAPLLFQHRVGLQHRAMSAGAIRDLLNTVLSTAGIADAAGKPLNFTPHDFRRMFITDAIRNGMPPHIAQLVAGHRQIGTTMGYMAVYPEEVINGHRAFIARRREQRPSAEYRQPTDEEWDEFLGHFEKRKVAHGTCGRAFGSTCIHEHACIRCPMLRPDPAQAGRLVEVADNLRERIAEAQMHGWLGEVEGLQVSLAAAKEKIAQAQQLSRRAEVNLGLPNFGQVAGRDVAATTEPRRPPR